MSIAIIPNLAEVKSAVADAEAVKSESSDLDFDTANTQVLSNEAYRMAHEEYAKITDFSSKYHRVAMEGDNTEKSFLQALGDKISALWRWIKETFRKFVNWITGRTAKEKELEAKLTKFFEQEVVPGLEKLGSEMSAEVNSIADTEAYQAVINAHKNTVAQEEQFGAATANKIINLQEKMAAQKANSSSAAEKRAVMDLGNPLAAANEHVKKAARVAGAYEMAKRRLVSSMTTATKNQLIFNIAFSNDSKSVGVLDEFIKSLGLELSPISSDILASMRKNKDYTQLEGLMTSFFQKYEELKGGAESLSARALSLVAELKAAGKPHVDARSLPQCIKVFQLSTEISHSIKYVLSNFESDLQVSDTLAVVRATSNAVAQGAENNIKVGQHITRYQGHLVQVLTALRTIANDCTIPAAIAHDLLVFKGHYEGLVETYKTYQVAQTPGEIEAKEYLESILPEFSKL